MTDKLPDIRENGLFYYGDLFWTGRDDYMDVPAANQNGPRKDGPVLVDWRGGEQYIIGSKCIHIGNNGTMSISLFKGTWIHDDEGTYQWKYIFTGDPLSSHIGAYLGTRETYMNLIYKKGDATEPHIPRSRSQAAVIAHICNDIGVWGKGFVMAVSSKWPQVREKYLEWHKSGAKRGDIQMIQVTDDIWVCNMIAQKGIRSKTNLVPLDMVALETCLAKLSIETDLIGGEVHMPKIGCGLAGGDWAEVSELIKKKMVGIRTHVYEQ